MTGGEERRRGPERIDSILARFLAQSGLLDGDKHQKIREAWQDVASDEVASLTKVLSFRGGTLTVGVESAPLYQELETFQSEELLRGLRERLRGVHVERLRFRLV